MEDQRMIGRIRVKDFSALRRQSEITTEELLANDIEAFFNPTAGAKESEEGQNQPTRPITKALKKPDNVNKPKESEQLISEIRSTFRRMLPTNYGNIRPPTPPKPKKPRKSGQHVARNQPDKYVDQEVDVESLDGVAPRHELLINQIVDKASQSGQLADNVIAIDVFNPVTETFENQSTECWDEGMSIRIQDCESLAPQPQPSNNACNDSRYTYQGNASSENVFNRNNANLDKNVRFQNRPGNYNTNVNVDSSATTPVQQPSTNIVFSGGTAVLVNSYPQTTHVQMPHSTGSTFIVHNPGSVASTMQTTVPSYAGIDKGNSSRSYRVVKHDNMRTVGDKASQYRVVNQNVDVENDIPQYRIAGVRSTDKGENISQFRAVGHVDIDKGEKNPQYVVVDRGDSIRSDNVPQYRLYNHERTGKESNIPQYLVVDRGSTNKGDGVPRYRVVGHGGVKETNAPQYLVVDDGGNSRGSNASQHRSRDRGGANKGGTSVQYRVMGHEDIDKGGNAPQYQVVDRGSVNKGGNALRYRISGGDSPQYEDHGRIDRGNAPQYRVANREGNKGGNVPQYRTQNPGGTNKGAPQYRDHGVINKGPSPQYRVVNYGATNKGSDSPQFRVVDHGGIDNDHNISQYQVLDSGGPNKGGNAAKYRVVNQAENRDNVPQYVVNNENVSRRGTSSQNRGKDMSRSIDSLINVATQERNTSVIVLPNDNGKKTVISYKPNNPSATSDTMSTAKESSVKRVVPSKDDVRLLHSLLLSMVGCSSVSDDTPQEPETLSNRLTQVNPTPIVNQPSTSLPTVEMPIHQVNAVKNSTQSTPLAGNSRVPTLEITTPIPRNYPNSAGYMYDYDRQKKAILENFKKYSAKTHTATEDLNKEMPVMVQDTPEHENQKTTMQDKLQKDSVKKSKSNRSEVKNQGASVREPTDSASGESRVDKTVPLGDSKKTGSKKLKTFPRDARLKPCSVLLYRLDIDELHRTSQLKNSGPTNSERTNKEDYIRKDPTDKKKLEEDVAELTSSSEEEKSQENYENRKVTTDKKKLGINIAELISSTRKEKQQENHEKRKLTAPIASTDDIILQVEDVKQLPNESTKKKKRLDTDASSFRLPEKEPEFETIEKKASSSEPEPSCSNEFQPVKTKKKKSPKASDEEESLGAVLSFMKDFGKQSSFPCSKCDRDMPTSKFWVNARTQELLCQICIVKSYSTTSWDDGHKEDLIEALLAACNSLITDSNGKQKEKDDHSLDTEKKRQKEKKKAKESRKRSSWDDDWPRPKRLRIIDSDSDSSD